MPSTTAEQKGATILTLHVKGMACSSCAGRVDAAIRKTPGVISVSVDLEAKRAIVTFAGKPDPNAVITAVVEAGYEAELEPV